MKDDDLFPDPRLTPKPGETDDERTVGGCGGAIVGCFVTVLIIGLVAAAVWLFWPGGDKP